MASTYSMSDSMKSPPTPTSPPFIPLHHSASATASMSSTSSRTSSTLTVSSSEGSLQSAARKTATKSHATSFGASVIRRQSSSWKHVKTHSLVSSSPFKVPDAQPIGPKFRPPPTAGIQRGANANTNTNTNTNGNKSQKPKVAKNDENKRVDEFKKARQSKGLDALTEAEAVSRSPFKNGSKANSMPSKVEKEEKPFKAPLETPPTTPEVRPQSPVVSTPLKVQTTAPLSTTPQPRQLPPTPSPVPCTPPRPPRVAALASPSGSATNSPTSPRSNLVSRRLHGPRSPSGSPRSEPGSAQRRRRRKTVTFDERCDVLEFEQDDEFYEDEEGNLIYYDDEYEEGEYVEGEGDESWSEHHSVEGVVSPGIGDTIDSVVESILAEDAMKEEHHHNRRKNHNHHHEQGHENSFRSEEEEVEEFDISHDMDRQLLEEIGDQLAPRLPSTDDQDWFTSWKAATEQHENNNEPVQERATLHEKRVSTSQIEFGISNINFDNNHAHPRLEEANEYVPQPEPMPAPAFNVNQPGVVLDDVKSALDRLMVGVERGFDSSMLSVNDIHEHDGSDHEFTGSILEPMTPEQRQELLEEHTVPMENVHTGTSTGSEEGPMTPQIDSETFLPTDKETEDEDEELKRNLLREPVQSGYASGYSSRPGSSLSLRPTSPASIPARKATIKRHEENIKAKRRQLRAQEGRPVKRRSMSTTDAELMKVEAALEQGEPVLPFPADDEVALVDELDLEFAKMYPDEKRSYLLRERPHTIYASDGKVNHSTKAGDVDTGRAWRAIKRPSDMFEYSKQIKEARSSDKNGKGLGKIFVRVLGITSIDIPLPTHQAEFSCVLNNGIHFVETPAVPFDYESRIDQEFELIEHDKLEFTLAIKIKKDQHITNLLSPPLPAAPPRAATPSRGVRSFFISPKKPKQMPKKEIPREETTDEQFAKYLKKDLTIGRAFVAFKDIAKRCDTKLFETSYPLIGQCVEDRTQALGNRQVITRPIGEIVLQMFRLPPIAGIPPEELPQSLDECHRGLRLLHWHQQTYNEGTLTQLGGDCSTWRRREFRVIGGSLIAFNDVSKKPSATIDLRQAVAVVDAEENAQNTATAGGSLNVPKAMRRKSSFNTLQGLEHSFKLVFDDDDLYFFADSAEEKSRWMDVLKALIGQIPTNPLWASMLWDQRPPPTSTRPSEIPVRRPC